MISDEGQTARYHDWEFLLCHKDLTLIYEWICGKLAQTKASIHYILDC